MFPVLYLLRASGLAIDPRKMLLGGLALVLLAAGNWLCEGLPFATDGPSVTDTRHHKPSMLNRVLSSAGFIPRPHIHTWHSWDAVAYSLLTPVRSLIEPCRVLFQTNNSWSPLAFAWTQLLWALAVWSLFGGALCRMNALQFATRKRIGLFDALKFSRRQWQNYLVAPLLPLSAVMILQGFNWLLGWLASLAPAVGDVILAIGWCVVLFCGFLMAMLVLGLALGWPLMIAAISTEDSDGFDGLSRTFGYLFDRPWHVALFAFSSLPIFAASRLLVAILVGLTVSLATDAVERGRGATAVQPYFTYVFQAGLSHHSGLTPIGPAGVVASTLDSELTTIHRVRQSEALPEMATFAWICIPALLYVGFGPAFFWSATTVTYFLLRQSDDGTPLDSVADWAEKHEPETSTTRTEKADAVSSEAEE